MNRGEGKMHRILWELFKKTGNIQYYLLAKKLKEKK